MLNVANFVITSLRAAIGPSDVSLPLAVGTSSLFNYMAPGDTVYLTIKDRTTREIVLFTKGGALANDNLTPVTRGQDGTVARAFPAGSCVIAEWTIAQLQQFTEQIAEQVVEAFPPFANTITLTNPPSTPPDTGILFAIDTTVPALYYWTGIAWIQLTNGGTPINPGDFGSGATAPGPTTPGVVYLDTSTGMVYVLIGPAWVPVLAELWPAGPNSPPTVQPGESLTFDAQGRLIAHTDVFESISRTAALGVAQSIPAIGGGPLDLTVDNGQYGTILSPQGSNAIRITVPAGKTAYVRLVANCSVTPAAPLVSDEVTQLSIKKSDGSLILPTPAIATDDPATTGYAPAGSTASQFFNVSCPVIPFPAGTYDICLFMASETAAAYDLTQTVSFAGATLYAELVAVR